MSPVPPPAITAPYDTLQTILNTARVRMNDAIQSLGGDILQDTQPFTQQMANDGWRKLQAYLATFGFGRYKRKYWGYAFPVAASSDPSVFQQWSWTFFFDGTSYYQTQQFVLPADLICPLYLKERQTGSNGPFNKLTFCPDGLPEASKQAWNRCWEWKNDTIYIPGSTCSMDFEVEYAAYDVDFVNQGDPTAGGTWWYDLQVPVMRCRSSLANFICAEAAAGRDDMDVESFIQQAREDAKMIIDPETRLRQRTPVQRGSYSGRGGRDQLWGSRGY